MCSGNVQSGRRCNMEGAAALTTTRLFSSLQLQPYDTRYVLIWSERYARY